MKMEIVRGKIRKAKKVVVYGPEGIGKSTFASRFPDPVFIDTEGSTNDMDVARLPRPTSWTMLLEEIDYVKNTPGVCRTLVIDTIDWAEMLCIEHICDKHHKNGIESFGYGNGYVYVKEEFGKFLNKLSDVIEVGVHVVLTAHAQLRKFEQPDEMGAYDRWELKLGKKTSSQTSPLVKEWADMLLFCNYKTYAVAVDDAGKKHKAQGGKRVMYTSHHPCWDAKNRYGLPEECAFDYSVIKGIIETGSAAPQQKEQPVSAPVMTPPVQPVEAEPVRTEPEQIEMKFDDADVEISREDTLPPENSTSSTIPGVPKALSDLMTANGVTEWDIQAVCARRGYYPEDTPIANYDPDFVSGVLVAAWPQVYAMIEEYRKEFDVPFKEDK